MDKTTNLKGWLFCENQRVSAGDYKNFPQTPQILAEFIHKIILSYHLQRFLSYLVYGVHA
jgi:hypothetical protein